MKKLRPKGSNLLGNQHQLELIEKVGLQNYLQSVMGEPS